MNKGERYIRFIERFCRHAKGSQKGQLIVLEEWQKEIVRDIFGTERDDGSRQYQEAYIQVAKKNAKTTLFAAVMVAMLFIEPGQDEIYFAAAGKDQARIAFDTARYMIENEPRLSGKATIYKNSIISHGKVNPGGFMKVISSDASVQDGMNPSSAIVDEVHQHKNRDLYDIIVTSGATRDNPLTINITTAGAGKEGIGWEQYKRAKAKQDGILNDDTLYVRIYEPNEGDDPFSEETWAKANPGLGSIVKVDFIKKQALRAKADPSFMSAFLRYHLNMWTSSHSTWLPFHEIKNCFDHDLGDLSGRECYAGLDIASIRDLSSLALFFPDPERHRALIFSWCPQTQVEKKQDEAINYYQWAIDNWIKPTGGNAQNHDEITEDILGIFNKYKMNLLGFDRAKSIGIIPKLVEAGVDVEPIPQTTGGLSEPMKKLGQLLLDGGITFNSNPVIKWQLNNVAVKVDGADNIYPNKSKAKGKIDGVVALIMAIAAWQIDGQKVKVAGYSEHGFRTL